MLSLADLMERAGLVTLTQANIIVPNYRFPVIYNAESGVQEYVQSLICQSSAGHSAAATLLYFTLPGCENCRPGLQSFRALADESSQSPHLREKVCFRVVVSDWPTRPEIEEELNSLSWRSNVGVVWDAEGVLTERLAVLGQPALFIIDAEGRLAAYQNGPISFAAPGFEVFWATFTGLIKNNAKNRTDEGAWFEALHIELPVKSNQTVTFLNNGALSLLWLVAAGAVCYSLVRFFLRLRKNFNGS